MSPDTRASTRATIVSAARRLFYLKGYTHTSLTDLAAFAGVPKGSFYYHFKAKDDVLRAVLAERRDDVAAALDRWRTDLPDPRARLIRITMMLTNIRDDLSAYGCPTGSLLTELGKHHDDLKADATTVMEAFVAFAAEQFVALGHRPPEARTMAIRLLGRCQGAIVMAHTYGDPEVLDTEVADIRRWLDDVSTGTAP